VSLDLIEQQTKEHAADRALVAERVSALNAAIEQLKRQRLPGIKSAVAKAKDSRLLLHAALTTNRDLFVRPRTRILHGIRVGWQKAKGKITFADPKQVVRLIRKHFEDKVEVLVKTKETPIRIALAQLPAADLKKLGCSVSDAADEVCITPADSDVDKLVDALLSDGIADIGEEEE
jgi:hypothetical protein